MGLASWAEIIPEAEAELRCNSAVPEVNQTPLPRSAGATGFGVSSHAEDVGVELPQRRLGSHRRGEPHVVWR